MEKESIRVGAVLSTGRLMFSETAACCMQAFSALGIALTIKAGVFWDQGIQGALSDYVNAEYDYIFTLDYDTIFTAKNVKDMLTLMVRCPNIDALCAVQFRRNMDKVMLLEIDADKPGLVNGDYSTDVTQILTGHFGLTVLRAEKLKAMSKPWFLGRPGPTGEYDKDRADPDVSFWEKWVNNKNTLYQANKVRIGHLQLMSTWAGKDFQPVHQYTKDFRENGPPQEVLDVCK